MNSVTIVGFVGADPEQRQARNNGSKFTVLSVATQRSWKNAEDEWVSKVEWHRVAIFRPRLAEAVLTNIKKALMCSSKAASSARPTNNRTARARSRKPRRLRRGRFALMSCAGLIGTSNNRKSLPARRRRNPTRLRSDCEYRFGPGAEPGPNLFFGSVITRL
jgi:hypothetical protein